jgi:hypothetical protein
MTPRTKVGTLTRITEDGRFAQFDLDDAPFHQGRCFLSRWPGDAALVGRRIIIRYVSDPSHGAWVFDRVESSIITLPDGLRYRMDSTPPLPTIPNWPLPGQGPQYIAGPEEHALVKVGDLWLDGPDDTGDDDKWVIRRIGHLGNGPFRSCGGWLISREDPTEDA